MENDKKFGFYERLVVSLILIIISITASFDIWNDYQQGTSLRHLGLEASLGLLSLLGALFLWISYLKIREKNITLTSDLSAANLEAARWKEETARMVSGLSHAIDEQLNRWHLTPAEKEVALLLLKGLSLKEISAVRNTSEGSARQQAFAVYQKSKLNGRSELSAFFLEDLLSPQGSVNFSK